VSNRVNYVHEDGTSGPSGWTMDGRPLVGDQVRRSGGEIWEVVTVQHDGQNQFRCICRTVTAS
jgi:hypothetical protein